MRFKNSARCLRSLAVERPKDFRSWCFSVLGHPGLRAAHRHNCRRRRAHVEACLHRKTFRRCNTAGQERLHGSFLLPRYQTDGHRNKLTKRSTVRDVFDLGGCRLLQARHLDLQWFQNRLTWVCLPKGRSNAHLSDLLYQQSASHSDIPQGHCHCPTWLNQCHYRSTTWLKASVLLLTLFPTRDNPHHQLLSSHAARHHCCLLHRLQVEWDPHLD